MFYLVVDKLREWQTVEIHPQRNIQEEFGSIDLACARAEDIDVEVISIRVRPWEPVNPPKERM